MIITFRFIKGTKRVFSLATRFKFLQARHHSSTVNCEIASDIKKYTEVTRNHLTPEIQLHLVTPNCQLWHSKGENSPFKDPFWAFFWPGGQAMTRYVLDNPHLVCGRSVLDVGCGCGASAVAAAIAGAEAVVANDVDEAAAVAALLNAEINHCRIETMTRNLIGQECDQWDVVILGDMFYDGDFASMIADWLKSQVSRTSCVFIGDPGRLTFENHPMKSMLYKVMEYELPEQCRLENNGLTSAAVWRFDWQRFH